MIQVELSDFMEWMKSVGYSNVTIRKVVPKLTKLVRDRTVYIDMCCEDVRKMYWGCSKYVRHSFVYAWDCFSRYLYKVKADCIVEMFRKYMVNKGYSETTAYYASCKIKTLAKKFNGFCFSDEDVIRVYRKRSGKTRRAYLYSLRRFKEFVRENGRVVISSG